MEKCKLCRGAALPSRHGDPICVTCHDRRLKAEAEGGAFYLGFHTSYALKETPSIRIAKTKCRDTTHNFRVLPRPPRCRGISIGHGNYTGCSYGYGDDKPFTGNSECPTCNGSGFENIVSIMTHSEFGDPDCCGCLVGFVIDQERATIDCDECAAVVRTVPTLDLQKAIDEMELGLVFATPVCPFCKSVNLFSGFTEMFAFRCQECHTAVNRQGKRSVAAVS
jgi:hypothetical protein